jgi:hypothetical protein
MAKAASKPKEFPKFNVGDVVQKIAYGPMAEHRTIEAVGEQDHVLGYVQVSGLLGWHSARGFAPVSRS